jgi:hypothetical protein
MKPHIYITVMDDDSGEDLPLTIDTYSFETAIEHLGKAERYIMKLNYEERQRIPDPIEAIEQEIAGILVEPPHQTDTPD